MIGLRTISMIFAGIVVGSTLASPTFASVSDPCFEYDATIETITQDLVAKGWTTSDRNDAAKNDTILDHLTWMGMPQYFAGDSGGQSLDTVLGMKRMSASGFLRKADLPTAQTRIMTRETSAQTEVAKIAWIKSTEHYSTIHCTFSLHKSSFETWTDVPTDAPAFVRVDTLAPKVNDAQASKDIVALNGAAVMQSIGVTPPSDAIVETYFNFISSEN